MSHTTGGAVLARQRDAGAPSARALLLTLLGECVLPDDGTAWTSSVIGACARLGVEEKATRQALMRTAAGGWLAPEKVGRRTRWRLTDSARDLLRSGAERIYAFTGPAADWDGRWLLLTTRIPEGDRRARHLVRTRLRWAGFGSLAPGVWISPHPERAGEATRVLEEAGAAGGTHLFVARRDGLGDVREMVAAAWDLATVEEDYEAFVARFRGRAPADVLARQVELVHAWRRFPSLDPVLPRELLPARWSGHAAARLFADRHARWAEAAAQEWRRLNAPG